MIYLDNAATSFPKAPGVSDRMKYYLDSVGASINRGVYASAQEAGLVTLTLREQLCALLGHDEPTRVLLTSGATAALNLALSPEAARSSRAELSHISGTGKLTAHNAASIPDIINFRPLITPSDLQVI